MKHLIIIGRQLIFLFTLGALAMFSTVSGAKGDLKAGSEIARLCQVCHGKGGRSTKDTYPVLAGQHSKYIVKQLKAFKAGTRKDPIMNGMASKLNEKDMEDVAAFFSNNSPIKTPINTQ